MKDGGADPAPSFALVRGRAGKERLPRGEPNLRDSASGRRADKEKSPLGDFSGLSKETAERVIWQQSPPLQILWTKAATPRPPPL